MNDSNQADGLSSQMCEELQRATILVRIGEHGRVQDLILRARSIENSSSNIRLKIWIMFLEGLLAHFMDADPRSGDRIRRALALSEASGDLEMTMRLSAWSSHMEFETGNFIAAARLLRRCIESDDTLPKDIKSRVYMVAALCCSYANLPARALRYYTQARRIAVEINDRATIGAVLYNQAAFGINSIRMMKVLGRISPDEALKLSSTLSSSVNFDALIGAQSLTTVSRILRARVFCMQGRFHTALRLLEAQREVFSGAAHLRARSALIVDIAWCLCELKRYDLTVKELTDDRAVSPDDLDLDDRVVYFSVLNTALQMQGDEQGAAQARDQGVAAELTYRRSEDSLKCLISAFLPE